MFHKQAAEKINVLDDENLFFSNFADGTVEYGAICERMVVVVDSDGSDFGDLVVFV